MKQSPSLPFQPHSTLPYALFITTKNFLTRMINCLYIHSILLMQWQFYIFYFLFNNVCGGYLSIYQIIPQAHTQSHTNTHIFHYLKLRITRQNTQFPLDLICKEVLCYLPGNYFSKYIYKLVYIYNTVYPPICTLHRHTFSRIVTNTI